MHDKHVTFNLPKSFAAASIFAVEAFQRWFPVVRPYLIVVTITMTSFIAYWTIVGFQLTRSIDSHIAECEEHIKDPETQKCVLAFIPVQK